MTNNIFNNNILFREKLLDRSVNKIYNFLELIQKNNKQIFLNKYNKYIVDLNKIQNSKTFNINSNNINSFLQLDGLTQKLENIFNNIKKYLQNQQSSKNNRNQPQVKNRKFYYSSDKDIGKTVDKILTIYLKQMYCFLYSSFESKKENQFTENDKINNNKLFIKLKNESLPNVFNSSYLIFLYQFFISDKKCNLKWFIDFFGEFTEYQLNLLKGYSKIKNSPYRIILEQLKNRSIKNRCVDLVIQFCSNIFNWFFQNNILLIDTQIPIYDPNISTITFIDIIAICIEDCDIHLIEIKTGFDNVYTNNIEKKNQNLIPLPILIEIEIEIEIENKNNGNNKKTERNENSNNESNLNSIQNYYHNQKPQKQLNFHCLSRYLQCKEKNIRKKSIYYYCNELKCKNLIMIETINERIIFEKHQMQLLLMKEICKKKYEIYFNKYYILLVNNTNCSKKPKVISLLNYYKKNKEIIYNKI